MQFLWLILLQGTDPSCVLFMTLSLLRLWVHTSHQMPSFFLTRLQANQKETLQSNLSVWAAGWATGSLENSWSQFYPLCQLCQADVTSTSCTWRHLSSPMTWGVRELVTIFLSARLSSSRSVLFNKRPGRWQWGVTMVVACDMHFGNNIFLL